MMVHVPKDQEFAIVRRQLCQPRLEQFELRDSVVNLAREKTTAGWFEMTVIQSCPPIRAESSSTKYSTNGINTSAHYAPTEPSRERTTITEWFRPHCAFWRFTLDLRADAPKGGPAATLYCTPIMT